VASDGDQRHRATVLERIGWVPFACAIGVLLLVSAASLTWLVSPYWGRNGDQARLTTIGACRPTPRPGTALTSGRTAS
jgi:hypothetical protein